MSTSISDARSIGRIASSPLVFKDPAALSLLSLGEEMKISVLQRLSSRQYLIAVKERTVLADSASPLTVGGELRVRVDKHYPAVVLKILSAGESPKDPFIESLRVFRANPQALLIHLGQMEQLLAKATLIGSLPPHVRDDIGVLLHALRALRYPQGASDATSYLKSYLANLGLLLEGDLKKILDTKEDRKLQNDSQRGGVKGLLFRLADEVNPLLGDRSLNDETRHLLEQLLTSTEKSLKTLENQQILNVMLQETGHAHMLQIPIICPGGTKLGEIFIRRDEHDESRQTGEKSFTVELLFEFDALGHFVVEVHLHDRKLDCLCTCGDDAAAEFVTFRLPELKEQLSSAGYTVGRLTCVVDLDVEEQKTAWYRQYLLSAGECINFFA